MEGDEIVELGQRQLGRSLSASHRERLLKVASDILRIGVHTLLVCKKRRLECQERGVRRRHMDGPPCWRLAASGLLKKVGRAERDAGQQKSERSRRNLSRADPSQSEHRFCDGACVCCRYTLEMPYHVT